MTTEQEYEQAIRVLEENTLFTEANALRKMRMRDNNSVYSKVSDVLVDSTEVGWDENALMQAVTSVIEFIRSSPEVMGELGYEKKVFFTMPLFNKTSLENPTTSSDSPRSVDNKIAELWALIDAWHDDKEYLGSDRAYGPSVGLAEARLPEERKAIDEWVRKNT